MKFLIWYRKKKEKDARLSFSMKGKKEEIVQVIGSIHECLWNGKDK